MTGELEKKYATILEYRNKIEKLQKIIDETKELNSLSSLEKEKAEILSLIENMENRKKEMEMIKENCEDSFCQEFRKFYRIGIKFNNDSISCYEIFDKKGQEYRNKLEEYKFLLASQGFDEEDEFKEIMEIDNKIFNFIQALDSVEKFICGRGELGPLGEPVYQKMVEYMELKKQYQYFIEILNNEAKRALSSEVIEYILDNTNLFHLIYANNKDIQFWGSTSLYRKTLCHFHVEKTPSMRVSVAKNCFRCFGCGKQGNQFDYLMGMEGLTYDEVTYLLAEVCLIDIPENPMKNQKYIELVSKYRNALFDDEYKKLLLSIYTETEMDVSTKNKYLGFFDQIDRVKLGKIDSNFHFQEKPKKYKYKYKVKE